MVVGVDVTGEMQAIDALADEARQFAGDDPFLQFPTVQHSPCPGLGSIVQGNDSGAVVAGVSIGYIPADSIFGKFEGGEPRLEIKTAGILHINAQALVDHCDQFFQSITINVCRHQLFGITRKQERLLSIIQVGEGDGRECAGHE